MQQDGSELGGAHLIERLENELVAQTAALDSLLNASGKRGRKQSDLPLTQSQVGLPCVKHTTSHLFEVRCVDMSCCALLMLRCIAFQVGNL